MGALICLGHDIYMISFVKKYFFQILIISYLSLKVKKLRISKLWLHIAINTNESNLCFS